MNKHEMVKFQDGLYAVRFRNNRGTFEYTDTEGREWISLSHVHRYAKVDFHTAKRILMNISDLGTPVEDLVREELSQRSRRRTLRFFGLTISWPR